MIVPSDSNSRAGWLCFHAATGATVTAILWLWLIRPTEELRESSLLLPLLFAVALPGVTGWIPVTVARPFFEGKAARRILCLAPGLMAIFLLIGRFLTEKSIFAADDLIVATCAAATIHLSAIMLITRENGQTPRVFQRVGLYTVGSWLAGAGMTGIGGMAAGLAMGALGFFTAGILQKDAGLMIRGPWIRAERSIGRFARLADLLRLERSVFQQVLAFGILCGLTLASLAWLPALWPHLGNHQEEVPALTHGHLSLMAIGFALGLAAGSLLASLRFLKNRHRFQWAVPFLILGSSCSIVWLAMDPLVAASATFLVGGSIGIAGQRCREAMFSAFDGKGARLPRESEATLGTIVCLCFGLAGGCLLIAEWTMASPLPPVILLGGGMIFLGFRYWKLESPERENSDVGPKLPDSAVSRPLDVYLPGIAPVPDSLPQEDGVGVSILYEVPGEKVSEFQDTMAQLSSVRRREGALQWRLTRSPEEPDHFTESFLLESWKDYQDAIRHESAADRAVKQKIFDLNSWESLPLENREPLEEI